ncbi:hypothetical protein [Bailinhaonella thermotolerans]|uniref:hypothetical protein n=1 Tax=Bailinhaonella thermotolerans TaxID=1070861 RepID=UPI0011C38B81|nr:hypothetical protein [Bailinhaonella thermotolerans]
MTCLKPAPGCNITAEGTRDFTNATARRVWISHGFGCEGPRLPLSAGQSMVLPLDRYSYAVESPPGKKPGGDAGERG